MTNQMQMKKSKVLFWGASWGRRVAGFGAAAAEDVAYEDSYGSDYYYPADVAYAGVYAGYGAGYGLYFAVPTGVKSAADGGVVDRHGARRRRAGHPADDDGRLGMRRSGGRDEPRRHAGVRQQLRRRADRVQRLPAAVRSHH